MAFFLIATSAFVGIGSLLLFQKSADNLFFCLLLGQAQGHKLDDLFSCDLADGRLVDQAGVQMIRVQGWHRVHMSFIHQDRVAFCMAVTLIIAADLGIEHLGGFPFCH